MKWFSGFRSSRPASRHLHFEPLETRQLLAAQPAPEWFITTGSPDFSLAFGTAIHPSGDVYMTAHFNGTADFDPGPGTAELTSAGEGDLAVARYTADGRLIWARQVASGPLFDVDTGIDFDKNGNAYIAFRSSAATNIGGTPYAADAEDGFLIKLDDAGNVLWTRHFALPGSSRLSGVAIDDTAADPNQWVLFVTGNFNGTGQFGGQSFPSIDQDAFVSKLTANSGDFVWTHVIGGANHQTSNAIALSTTGELALYAAGISESVTKVKGVNQVTKNNYVARIDPATGSRLWSRNVVPQNLSFVGGTLAATDTRVFIGGSFTGTADFDPGAGVYGLTSMGSQDAAVVSLDTAGNFVWARRMGGSSSDSLRGLAIGPSGDLYATGGFRGPADFGGYMLVNSSGGYLALLDSATGDVLHAQAHSGLGIAISVDGQENVYVGGSNSPIGEQFALLKFAPPQDPPIHPQIDTIEFSSGNVLAGDPLTLAVSRMYMPSQFTAVGFYRDANGNGTLEPNEDVLVGQDQSDAAGWSTAISTTGLPTGDHTYFAEGTDGQGVVLDVAAATLHVQAVETVSYTSANTPKQIPDRATVTSTISVPNSFNVLDVDVHLNISHNFDADLDVFLIGPTGTRVQLFADIGGGGDNFSGTILDDEAITSIAGGAAPFTGRFKPQNSLSAFDGQNAAGLWTLEVTDDERRDTGTLTSWSIQISRAVLPPALPLALFPKPPSIAGATTTSAILDAATVDRLLAEPESTWRQKVRVKMLV
jgi:subtilisin-like proprotein convertase family protein